MPGSVILKPGWIQTANADNSTATATEADATKQTHYITSVAGGYDATVSGNTLILKDGSTEVGRWMVYDTFAMVFTSPIPIEAAANLELEASGTGGVTGAATMTGYTL